jgi:hypothetical protein
MASRIGDTPRKLLVLCADEELGEASAYWGRALGFTVDTSSSGS